ncbi:hypothetical protein EMPG_16726 [Blastomyces silverae]|uniref:Ecp2 effector protein domain-containing protein n=1 Tax=Blastomyces silverae TaxID=2060906 RepID=A0A0H1B9S2_9EURO|nr:hypothetical protein EMPG_16726 [Blastomyces silverae]
MRFFSLLAAFAAAVVIHAPAIAAENVLENAAENATASYSNFVPIKLQPPYNWIYGDKLGDRILQVLDAPYEDYSAPAWSHHIALQCIDWYYCNVTMVYTVGTGRSRSWIGVIFQGPWARVNDFVRQEGIDRSTAYNRVRVNDTEGADSNAFEVY